MEKAFTLIQVSDDSKTDYASYFLKGEVNFWWESTRALEGEGPVSWSRFTESFLEKLFRKSIFGTADEVELKFINRTSSEDLNLLNIILNQEIRRLSRQGGWVPLVIAAAFLLVMYVWKYGIKTRNSFSFRDQFSKEEYGKDDKMDEKGMQLVHLVNKALYIALPHCESNLWRSVEVEFLELKQGEKSVAEYEAKFTELARLAPGYVNTEIQKARRFQQGLKPEVRSGVVALQLKTYTSVVQGALVIESDQKLASKEGSDKKRKFDSGIDKADREESSQKFPRKFGGNRSKKFRRQGFSQTSSSVTSIASAPAQSTKPVVECKSYGKRNSGQCRKDVQCFKCDKKGHYVSECNSRNPGVTCFKVATQDSVGGSASQGPATSTTRARTFKMTKRSNTQESDVVADNIRITYQGQKQEKTFLWILEARKLLREGCEAYLAHIVDTEKKAPSLDEIPVVSEFSNVFPDEFPGLPPDREIEFSIDLIPGAGPVLKAPYHMAPV
ncbi:hypothetical protein AgCh_025152 [Apium graveolens]